MAKIALIGANGFIGTRLVEHLHLEQSVHTVVPLVRKPSSLAPLSRFVLPWKIADALSVNSLAPALTGCDCVIHSALGDVKQIEAMPKILCQAAHQAGIKRVVYLSSASVHGQKLPEGTTEESPLHTQHSIDYNNAKVRAERSFFKKAARYGLEAFALRPGVVYGPRSRWIADLVHDLETKQAWLYNQRAAVLNGIYVDNLCEALLLCCTAKAESAGVYLINDQEPSTWKDFYEYVAQERGVDPKAIHQVSELPSFHKSFQTRMKEAVSGDMIQAVLPVVPRHLKSLTKRLLEPVPTPPNAWTLPSAPKPRFTEELCLLQQNTTRLSIQKAQQRLGYEAKVPTLEGLRRSMAWMRFCE